MHKLLSSSVRLYLHPCRHRYRPARAPAVGPPTRRQAAGPHRVLHPTVSAPCGRLPLLILALVPLRLVSRPQNHDGCLGADCLLPTVVFRSHSHSRAISSLGGHCRHVAQVPSAACARPASPAPFTEDTVLAPLCVLAASVVNEPTVRVRARF